MISQHPTSHVTSDQVASSASAFSNPKSAPTASSRHSSPSSAPVQPRAAAQAPSPPQIHSASAVNGSALPTAGDSPPSPVAVVKPTSGSSTPDSAGNTTIPGVPAKTESSTPPASAPSPAPQPAVSSPSSFSMQSLIAKGNSTPSNPDTEECKDASAPAAACTQVTNAATAPSHDSCAANDANPLTSLSESPSALPVNSSASECRNAAPSANSLSLTGEKVAPASNGNCSMGQTESAAAKCIATA